MTPVSPPIDCAYEEFEPGRRFSTPSRTVTEADVINFVGVSGLFEDIFISDEAGRGSVWGKRVVPGPLTLSMAEGLSFLAGLFRWCMAQLQVDMVVRAPVFVGDTFRVHVEVVERRPTKKPDRGIVRFRHSVVNQEGHEVMSYDVTRMVRRRAATTGPYPGNVES